ncbi:MAG: tetratricopeptide repeat protein, partial [Planctomycetes bacterium]|nr:tetratricopeptide repeat protein [Planctomycetota bacterium]
MQIGAYRLEAELARGGMGVVYRGRGPDGEAVALKLLLEQSFPDPELERRFGREARALEALNHPGILRVRTHGVDRGRLFMVMDLLSGPTLAEVVEAEGPLPEARAVELGRQLAAALAHAHSRGIVHRDLKPENVILEGEAPVLVDFGLVRQLGFDASRLTETGTILGSPNYMAPEQTLGEGEVGPAADVYALGATLYFLLTGKPPFEGASVLAVLSQVAGQAPTPPSAHRPGLDPTLEALVLRCLEKAPEQRYPSAVVLGAALDGVGDPLPAGAARPGRRSSAPLLLFAVSLALALGAALAALLASPGPGRASELLSAAKAELEAGRYAEALAACEEAIRLEPEVARAHALRGSIRALRSEHIAAIADLDRALELDPALANAYAQRAVSELNLGRLSEAIADCDRALELGVQTPADVYLCRGACKERLARYEDALADYDQALGHDPDFVPALLSRGVCHSRLGHEAEAEASYTAVIERAPDAARAWSNRGKLRLNQGRRAEAIQDLERALELAPDDVETLISRGLCSEEDSETAIRYFTLAIELDPRSATAIVYRGVAQLKVGRLGEGLTDLERGLELDPGNALARLNRGNALRAMGREEEALADYDAGLASDELRGQTRATVQGVRDRLAAKLAGGNAPAGDPSAALAERTTPRELPRWDAAQRIEALDRALARDPD